MNAAPADRGFIRYQVTHLVLGHVEHEGSANECRTWVTTVLSLDPLAGPFKVAPAPNLIPYAPSGWSNKIVTTHTYGSATDTSSLVATSPIYIDWAVANLGVSNVTTAFRTNLYVDNVVRTYFTISYTVPANYWTGYIGYSIGLLSHGSHTITIKTDSTNQVSESNESDNAYTKTIFVN